MTEKLFQPLLQGTVPIYLGAPNVRDFVPDPGCYIDAEAHGGPEGLARYLLHLAQSPVEYDAFFAWRRRPLPTRFLELLELRRARTIDRMLLAATALLKQKRAALSATSGALEARRPGGLSSDQIGTDA